MRARGGLGVRVRPDSVCPKERDDEQVPLASEGVRREREGEGGTKRKGKKKEGDERKSLAGKEEGKLGRRGRGCPAAQLKKEKEEKKEKRKTNKKKGFLCQKMK
jgi:hypothetical protein